MRPGELFAGRFRIDALLGRGGMGEVYAATNVTLGRPVALKVLLAHVALGDDSLRRFLREARASASIRHPNVIEILDVIQDDHGVPAIVMELLRGRSLAESMHARQLPIDEIASLLIPVCSGVGTAHARGIVHRDLKPENIFLADEAGAVVPKVLDFGIAKVTDPLELGEGDAHTRTGAVLGTPHYMAPEQAFGERGVDHRADIWSLGVILYEALAGTRPFQGENGGQILRLLANPSPVPIAQRRSDVPREIVDLVSSMMEPDRTKRTADLTEVSQVLGRYTATRAPEFTRASTRLVATLPTMQSGDFDPVSEEPTQIAPLDSSVPSDPTFSPSTDPMTALPTITSPAVTADSVRTPPPTRRALVIGAVASAIAVSALAVITLRKAEPPSTTPPEPARAASTAPAIEQHEAPRIVKPAASVQLPSLPEASASSKPKPMVTAKTLATAVPKASATPAAPPATPTATGKGGLIETVPF